MAGYNRYEKILDDRIQEVKNEFLKKYNEVKKLDISDEEKEEIFGILSTDAKFDIEKLKENESIEEYIPNNNDVKKVDEELVNALVSLYIQEIKEVEENDKINTTEFEEKLRNYFFEHYEDIYTPNFCEEFSNSDLKQIAIDSNISPKNVNCIGYGVSIFDGVICRESQGLDEIDEIYYATSEGINSRINNLYTKLLYEECTNVENKEVCNNLRRLKNEYIIYAKENGIKITDENTLEEIPVDPKKIDAVSKYINSKINQYSDKSENKDDTDKIKEILTNNYSCIFGQEHFSLDRLKEVKELMDNNGYLKKLYIKVSDDVIEGDDTSFNDIIWAKPEYLKDEYENVMKKIYSQVESCTFANCDTTNLRELNKRKTILRDYISKNEVEGIDISVKRVEPNKEVISKITEGILEKYNFTNNKKDIVFNKIESKYCEVITESKSLQISKVFRNELKEVNEDAVLDELYLDNDFAFLNCCSSNGSRCLFATEDSLSKNIEQLDEFALRNDSFVAYNAISKKQELLRYSTQNRIQIDNDKTKNLGGLNEKLVALREKEKKAKELYEEYLTKFNQRENVQEVI